ncbi:hypothetical protein [Streptococcus sinensis]|uniref:Uncharacterized protein n=1 Tax=Streptococcus sinensis TaxID=176090 RepID=A0A0A0DGA4_9STRE|nr:hypothetical protein [Streptococcus sinensis]KGM37761.1 hypothetical protein SSIN_0443 [Streptococcus sinensis]
MKKFNLTKKKKVWLFILLLIALPLLAIVINIQLNQPEHMNADYVGLWKSRWHEENKDWLYPLKNICLIILAGIAVSGLMIAFSKGER